MSRRQAQRQFSRWVRYFRRWPWHDATPGMQRAYNRAAYAWDINEQHRSAARKAETTEQETAS